MHFPGVSGNFLEVQLKYCESNDKCGDRLKDEGYCVNIFIYIW